MSDLGEAGSSGTGGESPPGSTETMTYVYGRRQTTIEQISSGGTVTYLHHDQAGSTRLLTGSTGTVTGKCTYSLAKMTVEQINTENHAAVDER